MAPPCWLLPFVFSVALVLLPLPSLTHHTNGTMLLAIEVCRHGDRSPLAHFKFDALPLEAWRVGKGQLTPIGVRAHYDLGARLRDRYVTKHKFLSGRWNVSEVYVRASGIDRTIMSANAQMGGMFPRGSGQVFDVREQFGGEKVKRNEVWMDGGLVPPVIHSENEATDGLLLPGKNCDAYQRWLDGRKTTKEWKEKLEETKGVRKDLARLMEKDGEIDFMQLGKINDVWRCYEAHKVPLPLGITRKTRKIVRDTSEWMLRFGNQGKQTNRWKSGLLLYKIRKRMLIAKKIALGELKRGQMVDGKALMSPKFVLYSAHDTTVASLLSSLHIFDGKNPPYNSTIILELFQMDSDRFTIRIEYNGEIKYIPGCEGQDQCDLDAYLESTKERTFDSPEQRVKECALGMRKSLYAFGVLDPRKDAGVPITASNSGRSVDFFGFHIGAVGALVAMVLVVVAIIGCFCYGRREKRGGRYETLDSFEENENLVFDKGRERQTILM